jgi:hypothetical protein
MRYLPLQGLPPRLTATPAKEVGVVLRERLQSNTWPLPQASAILHAIMTWPNNEERRDLFLSACAAKASEAADIGRHSREGTADCSTATRSVLTLAGKPIGLGGLADAVIDELEAEMAAARVAWKNVADLMQTESLGPGRRLLRAWPDHPHRTGKDQTTTIANRRLLHRQRAA